MDFVPIYPHIKLIDFLMIINISSFKQCSLNTLKKKHPHMPSDIPSVFSLFQKTAKTKISMQKT